jgi:beta-lactamase regulating signal transducer with metallopeptidase domain
VTVLAAAEAAKGVMTTLALAAVQGTLLALLAIVLTRAGRLRPAWQSAIWLVVLAKFVLPWGPAMPWSLADVLASFGDSATTAAPLVLGPAAPAPVTPPPLTPAIGWLVLAGAWATGSSIVLVRALSAQHRALANARRAPEAPGAARALLVELSTQLGVRAPRLVIGDPVTSPHVVGVVRPVIVVPASLLSDEVLLRAALVHELAHIRRRDALARYVQLFATALFFFWPVVRLAARKHDLAREAACDAWALEQARVPRPAYARLLVRMAMLRTADGHHLASPRSLDARVAAVLTAPARARIGLVPGVSLLAWTALALGGARSAAARGQEEVCEYTLELAEMLLERHPEADSNGDGYVSKDEACEFQAEVRRRIAESDLVSRAPDPDVSDAVSVLAEPLCCNCSAGDGLMPSPGRLDATCQRSEGVDR